jgi:hypothetical protein
MGGAIRSPKNATNVSKRLFTDTFVFDETFANGGGTSGKMRDRTPKKFDVTY